MGVVVRRYIHVDILIIIITFPYSTFVSALFLAAASLFILKCFFVLYTLMAATNLVAQYYR